MTSYETSAASAVQAAASPGLPVVPAQPGGLAHRSPAPELGKVRGTGTAMLLTLVTFGLYPLYWYYSVHTELKRHTGTGLGGPLALVLAIFVGVASPFLVSSEVGELYARRGMPKPVSGATGLWFLPGALLLVGPIVWFVKTNGALNSYWRGLGAV